MKLGELAIRLGAELRGDSDLEITGVNGIEEASPSEITFVANIKYKSLARVTKAAAVIVEPEFEELTAATLRIQNPYHAFSRTLGLFYQGPSYPPGIHPTAVIDPSAKIAEGAHIGPYAVIGAQAEIGPGATILAHAVIYAGAKIGARFFAHAHAVVRENCILGDDVTLENGVIIGADGFGFSKNERGEWVKIPQASFVRIGNRVDVQANATIDRASIGCTEVGDGTKIDNLVQIGHGSRVGQNTLLCSQTGLAGSSIVGNNVILAGQVGVAGHLTIGDGAIATAQTGIPNDVEAGKVVSGYPAIDNKAWLRSSAVFQRLPELSKRLNALEARVEKALAKPEDPAGEGEA
jgi:UDP-3-O-[3-hydroxymyristoyl] glucosamine N-acyltransferase